MIRRSVSMLTLLVALVFSTNAIADLQSVAPEDAFARVSETEGVVFVDLYADW